ncbi:MAG: membrane protein insertion efficiency factor YidD [Gammaproteobacteria bacterium]|nr:membrane protein insertion efficiency factor YidD [Gammaproteobacteria bacterium]
MKTLLLFFVRTYRYLISPLLPATCRFYPSCSSYCEEAVREHGALHGGWLSLRRLSRCHPWHEGGVDLVPQSNPVPSAQKSAICNHHHKPL